eukprot:Gb_22104 [translate_table: standard]
MKLEEVVHPTLSSLLDEVVDMVRVATLPSEDSLTERGRKWQYLKMQEELIKEKEEKQETRGLFTRKPSMDSLKPRHVCIVALKRVGVEPGSVQAVIFGNILRANLGQAHTRQAKLGAGIPHSVTCTTTNKLCASGMKTTMLVAQSIHLGNNDVVVAGGMESMSNVPSYLPDARKGYRLRHGIFVDGMLKNGLWYVYHDVSMRTFAELCANKYQISREEQVNHEAQCKLIRCFSSFSVLLQHGTSCI